MLRNKKNKKIFIGTGLRVGIVVSEFNYDVTEKLLKGALAMLARAKVARKDIIISRVAGSFEIPLACARLAMKGGFDALVALGAVIKGETDHYFFVAESAIRGIQEVSLKHDIPIGFGVLTTENLRQAKERASTPIDAGGRAALASIRMAVDTR